MGNSLKRKKTIKEAIGNYRGGAEKKMLG